MRKRTLTTATLSGLLLSLCGQAAFAAWGGAPPKTGVWDPYSHPSGGKYAVVCTGESFTGDCYTLSRDVAYDGLSWTCYDSELGFPNDKIKSAVLGQGVRLFLFWNKFGSSDSGNPYILQPGYYTSLGSWNGNASAARLVDLNRSQNCADVSANELAIFSEANFNSSNPNGDCVILNWSSQQQDWGKLVFNRPYNTCFRNDNASSAKNRSGRSVKLYQNVDFGGSSESLVNGEDRANLSRNNSMSSVRFQ